jgi:ribose transport system permease protein
MNMSFLELNCKFFLKIIKNKSIIFLLILIILVANLNSNFFTLANIFNILQQTSVNAILAVGMTIIIITSGIDLSVGSLLALTGAVSASLLAHESNTIMAFFSALVVGACSGAVTGFIVAKGKVPAFIATLVMMLMLRGITLVFTDGSPISIGFSENAELFSLFGIGTIASIPTSVILVFLVIITVWFILNYTRLGRYFYAIGGNESAARLSGINVDLIKISAYIICGLLAALAGVIEVARLSSAQPTAGSGYELDAIAAVVLGGTSLSGGKGRISGTLIGALILGFLNNGLNILGISSYFQIIIKALVILMAVMMDEKDKS